jgi:hypothetical protein
MERRVEPREVGAGRRAARPNERRDVQRGRVHRAPHGTNLHRGARRHKRHDALDEGDHAALTKPGPVGLGQEDASGREGPRHARSTAAANTGVERRAVEHAEGRPCRARVREHRRERAHGVARDPAEVRASPSSSEGAAQSRNHGPSWACAASSRTMRPRTAAMSGARGGPRGLEDGHGERLPDARGAHEQLRRAQERLRPAGRTHEALEVDLQRHGPAEGHRDARGQLRVHDLVDDEVAGRGHEVDRRPRGEQARGDLGERGGARDLAERALRPHPAASFSVCLREIAGDLVRPRQVEAAASGVEPPRPRPTELGQLKRAHGSSPVLATVHEGRRAARRKR